MRRLKTRRIKNRETYQKKALLLFLIGIAIGLAFFIFYKIFKPPTAAYPTKKELPAVHVAVMPVPAPERARPKVAIVLDDFGYNYKNVEAIFKIRRPVTFSILPHHTYSRTIAERSHQKGYEAILHLPLEPYENDKSVKPEKITITTAMKNEEVLAAMTKALESVPYAKGASNHQGSRATEDAAIMEIVFKELKKRDLFFLDSLSTNKSVCRKVAKNIGIRFARRSVFLDNSGDFEYIKGQMDQLIRKAKRSGSAIGIGHDRAKTVAALSKLMPDAEKEGIEFVFLSELIR